jgi:cell division protein ZapB
MAESQIKLLADKIDQLIALCTQLNEENRQLKAEHEACQRERRDLLEKNEAAGDRVAAMIERLRTLE